MLVANISRISEILNEEVVAVPERFDGYRKDLVDAVEHLVNLEYEHRIEHRLDINLMFNAAFEGLGRSFETEDEEAE